MRCRHRPPTIVHSSTPPPPSPRPNGLFTTTAGAQRPPPQQRPNGVNTAWKVWGRWGYARRRHVATAGHTHIIATITTPCGGMWYNQNKWGNKCERLGQRGQQFNNVSTATTGNAQPPPRSIFISVGRAPVQVHRSTPPPPFKRSPAKAYTSRHKR